MCLIPLFWKYTRLGICSLYPFGGWGQRACVSRSRGGGRGRVGGETFCAGVSVELLWLNIYCAKPMPYPGSHYVSWSYMGLGKKYPWIIWDYDPSTVIMIHLSNQPNTCEMGYSIFSAMGWLKFVSTTRSSFPIIPSTERTNGEFFFRWLWKCLPCLYLFYLFHRARIFTIGSFL